MGRRNITEEQKAYLSGKQYAAEKKLQGGTGSNQFTIEQTGQSVHSATRREQQDGTAGRIGKEYGIDGRTIRRNEQYANGIDVIGESDPDLKADILAGKKPVTKQEVRSIIQPPVQMLHRHKKGQAACNK
jgi:hypothetical protein